MRPSALAFGAAAAVGVLTVAGCATASSRTSPDRLPALATGGAGAAPALFAVPGNVEYRAAGPLPALASHGLAYRVGAATTAERVAKLARGFGIQGSVVNDPAGWSVANGERSVHVSQMAGLPFTVSTTGAGSVMSGCAIALPATTSGGSAQPPPAQPQPVQPQPVQPPPTCPPPTTVPGLPSSADAQAVARAALSAAGFDLGVTAVDVTPNPSQVDVSFHRSIGGIPMAGNPWTVAVGPHGTISFATGLLADPVVAGDYPLVGVSAGLDRLNQGSRWIVYGGPGPVPMMGAVHQPAPLVCSGADCPVVTMPPKVVVTVTGVHLGLGWASLARPSMAEGWLVPVYVFELDHGRSISVLALSDDVLTPPGPQPAPATVTVPGPKPSIVPPSPPPVAPPGTGGMVS